MGREHFWFRQELGFHAPNTERGMQAWDDYEKGGPILFLGGPWHGRIVPIGPWQALVYMPNRAKSVPVIYWEDPDPFSPCHNEPSKYGLARARTPAGGLAYVYVATDDVREAWPEEHETPGTCRRVSAMFARHATRLFSDMMFARRNVSTVAAAFEIEFGRLCAVECGPMDDVHGNNKIRD